MTHRLVSTLGLLLAFWWVGCEQSGSSARNNTFLAPSMDEAAKTDPPIRILSGQLIYDPSQRSIPLIEAKGTKGFRLNTTAEGPFGPRGSCPCLPGEPIVVNSVSIGLDVRGTVTLRGKTYDRLSGTNAGDAGAAFEFQGEPFVAPPVGNAPTTVELSGPFTFSGSFNYYPGGPLQPSVTETFLGQGIATVQLTKFAFTTDLIGWTVTGAVFAFTK